MRQLALPMTALLLAVVAISERDESSLDKEAESQLVQQLIQKLSDGDYEQREAATKELEALGDKAIPQLRKTAAGDDPEARWRAQLILSVPRRKSPTLGLELALVKAGEFQMGSHDREPNRHGDEHLHLVSITRPFYLGLYEVTQEEYQRVMKTAPSSFAPMGKRAAELTGIDTARFPVEGVTWFDAIEFCNRLSGQDNFEPYYRLDDVKTSAGSITGATVTILGGYGYRLPTEAEWEYACRAATQTPYHYGQSSNGARANTKGVIIPGGYGADIKGPNLGRTTKVGSYPANPWGLFDMHGNVGEWCWDYYDKDYYPASPRKDPSGPDTGGHRVIRGGSWLVPETNARSACRYWQTPDETKDFVGFRVARNL